MNASMKHAPEMGTVMVTPGAMAISVVVKYKSVYMVRLSVLVVLLISHTQVLLKLINSFDLKCLYYLFVATC